MAQSTARTLVIASLALSGIAVSGVTRLPIVTRHDIRFINLAVDGEPLRKWVMAISQDSRGFIWLGTNDGLYRYDGYAVKSYRHDPNDSRTIGDNTIKVLFKDRAGILWIGTGYAGLDRFDPERETFTHYRHDPTNGRSLRSQTVTCIYQDRTGSLWVGTQGGLDRLDPTGRQFVHYEMDARDRTGHDEISAMYEDRTGGFWVGTPHGLYRLDRNGHLSPFRDESGNESSRGLNYVNNILADSAGTLWIGTPMGNGLSTLDPKSATFADYAFNGEEPGSPRLTGVNAIREDRSGTLWVGTLRDGLLRFDQAKRRVDRYFTQTNSSNVETIETLFEDTEGNMWVGTSHGATRFRTSPPPFVNYQEEAGNPDTLRNNTVWAVHADKSGFLWIGTAGGLHRLDRRTGAMAVYRHDPTKANSLSNDTISAIADDGSGGLWIGTHGGGVNHFDRSSERFTHYRHDPKNANSLSNDLVQCLLVDAHGDLWVGTHNGGLNRLDPRTGAFTAYRNSPGDPRSLSEDNVRVIYQDRAGALWIGTNHGLDRMDPNSRSITVYLHDPRDPTTLSHNSVGTIYEDHKGILWVGTRSGLNRLDRSSGKFAAFTVQDGIGDDAVEAIQEDQDGHLWLATHQGISEFQPLAKVARNYSEADGLPGNFENPNGTDRSCKTPSGEIVFGSAYGVTVFDPDRVSKSHNKVKPPVVLTDLLLCNKSVLPGTDSVLAQPIWATRAITLNHKQSIFTIEFTALSYAAPERNRYRYKLENLENWNEVDSKRRVATYTSLPPGKYVFRVQASNNDLVWNQEGAVLNIMVLPPWWASWPFRTVFGLILVAAVVAAHGMRVRHLRRTAARLELEVRERTSELEAAKESSEKANRAKSAFLAHMSHELRSPLNAVLGFATLLRGDGVTLEQRNKVDAIHRSGEHLLTLIDDVLDIAKIEAGKEQLDLARCDLIGLVRDVVEMMRVRAEANNLELRCIQSADFPQHVMVDALKLRQVLINLLGNAVKFTPSGAVTLRMSAGQQADDGRVHVRFEVEDTGPGIPHDDQQRIFDPFVQLGHSRHKGTGLGLTITRRFVEIMGGTITVESSPGGTLFAVEVPCMAVSGSGATNALLEGHCIKLEPGQPECRVLIVEDDPVNSGVLEEMLNRAGFSTRVANSGAAGVKAFEEWRPQFIWMDVRMPGMSGVEATRRIREMPGGKETRIAALTASAFESERDEVLSAGMDDFLRKPFRSHEVFDCMSRALGLRYCRVPNSALGSPRATVLPDALRQELRDALLLLDEHRISAVIESIADQDASIASELKEMADRMAYSEMLRAITGSIAKPA